MTTMSQQVFQVGLEGLLEGSLPLTTLSSPPATEGPGEQALFKEENVMYQYRWMGMGTGNGMEEEGHILDGCRNQSHVLLANEEENGQGQGQMVLQVPSGPVMQPILLTDETGTQTILLHIPESELAAILAANDVPNGNNQGFYITASILSSANNSIASNELVLEKKEEGLRGDPSHVTSNHESHDESAAFSADSVGMISDEQTSVIRLYSVAPDKDRTNVETSKKPKAYGRKKAGNTQTSVPKTPDEGSEKRKCTICGKQFKKRFNLAQHIRSHTGEKPFHCLVCGRGFTQKSNVTKHLATHKVWPKVKYTLPKEQISVKLKDLNQPLLEEQPNTNGNGSQLPESVEYIVNNVYVCQYCDQRFDNYNRLKTHLSHTHKSEKLFKCIQDDCLATFTEVEGLLSHVKTHQNEMEYQCREGNCPNKFKNLHELHEHQQIHRLHSYRTPVVTPKQFRCTKCNNKYASAEALNHHLLTSSHNYPCSQCQLTFVCERYLRRHLRVHGTVNLYTCPVPECSKQFKTENYLKSHLVIHSDSKPFNCEVCKQSFNRRDKLTRHKLMHDSRKKYKCPYKQAGCEREFYRKDKLKDHLLSHARRKSYPCGKCGKSFSWPVRLRRHEVTHHSDILTHGFLEPPPDIDESSASESPTVEPQDIEAEDVKPTTSQEIVPDQAGLGAMEGMIIVYSECDIDEGVYVGEKIESGVMLGSFNQADDPDSVVLTHYVTEMNHESCEDLGTGDDIVIPSMDMNFDLAVDGHVESLINPE